MRTDFFTLPLWACLFLAPASWGEESWLTFVDREQVSQADRDAVVDEQEADTANSEHRQDERDRDSPDFELEFDTSPANVYAVNRSSLLSTRRLRMRAEFESQSALLVSGGALCRTAPNVLADIAKAAEGHVPVVMLVNDETETSQIRNTFDGNEPRGIHLMRMPHDTVWARDYGPTIVLDGTRTVVVDAAYTDVDRSQDDQVPSALATLTNTPARHTPLCMPGGNLLTNGRGICLTTTRVQEENAGMTQVEIAETIADAYGASLIAILEPLQGESTGHVDMFATFTDEHTVVVGQYDHRTDAENAAILDRNAARLASVRVGGRKLRVVRIPMPSQRNDQWPTYTNVVYANGRLLVPIYEFTTPQMKRFLGDLYAALLPGWEVHYILVDDLICCGGALHCVVSNLGTVSPLQQDAHWGQQEGRVRWDRDASRDRFQVLSSTGNRGRQFGMFIEANYASSP